MAVYGKCQNTKQKHTVTFLHTSILQQNQRRKTALMKSANENTPYKMFLCKSGYEINRICFCHFIIVYMALFIFKKKVWRINKYK